MSHLKKIVEKPIKEDEIERLLWLHRGINTIDEMGRKAALEKNLKFMDKEGKYVSPEEFHALLFSKHVKDEDIPLKYQKELDRYHEMFVKNISEMLERPDIRDAKLGRSLGIPDAKENIFEMKKKGKSIGFVHLNKKDMTLDFIEKLEDVPNEFKKKLKKG
jgi:hypothetical protein